MNRQTFERIVAEAIDELPQAYLDRLDNVEIVVETIANPETLPRPVCATRWDCWAFTMASR